MVEPIFRDISADDDNPEVTELESLCLACHENGTTKILLTKIPFFKEVIISSFDCPHCGHKDNEIKPASEIQRKGVKYILKVNGLKDLSRQVVRQGSAMFRIEELDFEAPPFTSKGALTTIEGMIQMAIDGLEQQQAVRKIMTPDVAEKIDDIIAALGKHKDGESPFTLILEDVSGNSFIENPFAPKDDPAMSISMFDRSKEQSEQLGITEEMEKEEREKEEHLKDEVFEFPGNCHSCASPAITKMKILNIPHFKEVVIMATNCDACGEKSNEVKAGGGIEDKGTKIRLKMTDPTDLSRDILTSDTCMVKVPDLDMELNHSSDAGRFTTVEGLLNNIKDGIGRISPFAFGDSASKDKPSKVKEITDKLQEVIDGKRMVTIELDDPVGNSYIQNLYAPDPDPNMIIEKYERSHELEIELGIADMKTEDYSDEKEDKESDT